MTKANLPPGLLGKVLRRGTRVLRLAQGKVIRRVLNLQWVWLSGYSISLNFWNDLKHGLYPHMMCLDSCPHLLALHMCYKRTTDCRPHIIYYMSPVFLPERSIVALPHCFRKCHTSIGPRGPKGAQKEKKTPYATYVHFFLI